VPTSGAFWLHDDRFDPGEGAEGGEGGMRSEQADEPLDERQRWAATLRLPARVAACTCSLRPSCARVQGCAFPGALRWLLHRQPRPRLLLPYLTQAARQAVGPSQRRALGPRRV
jgi:hypothetical protein